MFRLKKKIKGEIIMTNQETKKKSNFENYLEKFESEMKALKEYDTEHTKKDAGGNITKSSNELASALRKELILKSFIKSKEFTQGDIYFSTKAYHTICNTLIMFTDNTNTSYATLLKEATFTFDPSHKCWKFSYMINEHAITDRYIRYLAAEYPQLDIPTPQKQDRLREFDNAMLDRLQSYDELAFVEAGILTA
jgi:hypothetical protein